MISGHISIPRHIEVPTLKPEAAVILKLRAMNARKEEECLKEEVT